jgi:hypothetical protein
MEEINLTKIVLEIDDELIKKGVEPYQRPHKACSLVAKKLGVAIVFGQGEDKLVRDIHDIYSKLYRSVDLVQPPLHIGVFMFKDIFFPIKIPLLYGQVKIDLSCFLKEIPENIRRWVFSDKYSGLSYFDQLIDIFDFTYSLDDIEKDEKISPEAFEYWILAKNQMEAAAATVVGSFNKYVAVQNSQLAVELVLKGVLITKEYKNKTLKKYGHNTNKILEETLKHLTAVDTVRLERVIKNFPKFSQSRYEINSLTRIEVGRMIMGAQFIAGEILRQYSNRNLRSIVNSDPEWDLSNRSFP